MPEILNSFKLKLETARLIAKMYFV